MVNFNSVSKVYQGSIVALQDATFSLNDGEFCFIVGPSGSGKSTIIRLLVRQELPTQGKILFGDVEITDIPRKYLSVYRQNLGVVFQDLKLIEAKTVRGNVEFALEIIGTKDNEIKDLTDYLLEVVGLQDRQKLLPVALSGGERQKAAIARALANNPKLFIADEPTGNLDNKTSQEILEILKVINKSGTTVLVVTHDKDIVDDMQTRVIHMEKGKIVADKVGGYYI